MVVGEKIHVADKETLDKVYNILAGEHSWGFIEHMDILSPSERITPIGLNKDYTNVTRNAETGVVSLNDWKNHPFIRANKPYMVKSDGTPDYMLSETDYTKKSDGTTDSDVSNTEYDGGAFAWLPRIYKYEKMDGNDRTVLFSMVERDGYTPNGFIDPDNNVLEGVWLPMFYGSRIGTDGDTPKMVSFAGLQPSYNTTADQERTAIRNFSTRAQFLGGALVETIIDFLMMISGTCDLQGAFGYGNCSGHVNTAPTYGVKQNAVVGGGQFYGTDDQKSLNKIFHSIVLGSYQQWQRDPYEVIVNGTVKISTNYAYDLTGKTYTNTGIKVPNFEGWRYPLRYQTVSSYGSVPVVTYDGGSTATGSCDGVYTSGSQSSKTAVARRFGDCADGLAGGLRARNWRRPASAADWNVGASDLLLPPVGVAV